MQKRAAILDLGTNTFHLLIVEKDIRQGFLEIYRKRIYVKLAQDGIELLSSAAMKRGMDALVEFTSTIAKFNVGEVRAIGTAALRTAANGPEYVADIKATTGLDVQTIDGDAEAALIHRGVSQIWTTPTAPVLIMDIGGGSVEFIIANEMECLWSASFPIGVAILHKFFPHLEPITEVEKIEISSFLEGHLRPLIKQLKAYEPETLIGASGTFDVLGSMLGRPEDQNYFEVSEALVQDIIGEILRMDLAARQSDARIPAPRVDLIIVALVLLKKVLSFRCFKKICVSSYALKEGVAANIFSGG